MLPRSRRVGTALFDTILAGKAFYGAYLTLRLRKTDYETSKFSFVASKKVAGKAVLRNFLRRRGYNLLSLHLKDIKTDRSGIFFFKKEVLKASKLDLEKDIVELLRNSDSIV